MSIWHADREVAEFERDGATVVRGVVEPERIAAMRQAIERALTDESATHANFGGEGGRFYNGFFHWLRDPVFKELITESRLPEVAARFLGAEWVNFFYDQLLVKEPQSPEATPWHIDGSYFPIAGGRLLSIWVPFDPASGANGAVTYIKGSHRWTDEPGNSRLDRIKALPKPGEPLPYETVDWAVEPGDVLIHDVQTVHGAPANLSSTRRRALATRWMDQDVRYAPRPDDLWASLRRMGQNPPEIPLEPGAPMEADVFPRVWPRESRAA